jgi:hypothetical protein
VRQWERFLREPDVGIALDREFSMPPGGVPGRNLGHTNAATVNRVTAYVAGLVARHRLPEKLVMVHQFSSGMGRTSGASRSARGWRWGGTPTASGPRGQAPGLRRIRPRPARPPGPEAVHEEDVGLLSAREVLRLRPVPQVIDYQEPCWAAGAG